MPQTHQGTWQNQVGRIPECLVQCLTKIHLIGTMSSGVPTCRVLSGALHRCVGQTSWLKSWTSQITLSGVPTCCTLSVIHVWPHLVCVPDTSEFCQSWGTCHCTFRVVRGPDLYGLVQTQHHWCGLLTLLRLESMFLVVGLSCGVYVWWVCLAVSKSISLGVLWWCVGLAGNNSVSLGVLWWCVGLAGNNFGSLGVLCALSLYSFPRLLLSPHRWMLSTLFHSNSKMN